MSNPGALIEHNGQAMTVTQWARQLGIKPVTLRARLRRYGMSIERAFSASSLAPEPSGDWYKTTTNDYEHRVIAARALGRPLPPKSEVHHVDGNKMNNDPGNLVICPDHAYHDLLHRRQEALDACGDANARKCVYCGGWDAVANLTITTQNGARHPKCHAKYMAAYRRKKLNTKEK